MGEEEDRDKWEEEGKDCEEEDFEKGRRRARGRKSWRNTKPRIPNEVNLESIQAGYDDLYLLYPVDLTRVTTFALVSMKPSENSATPGEFPASHLFL